MWKLAFITVPIAALALAGCATPSAPAPVSAGKATCLPTPCLPLAQYTPAQEAAMAMALQALESGNPLVVAMTDYGAMRAADRACLGLSAQ